MATRNVQDNKLNAAFRSGMLGDQTADRASRKHGKNYGQVLRGGLRPSDQPNDGPALPANLKNDAWIDVYEAPNGFGWTLTVEAVEAGITYHKTLTSHEDGPLVESAWVEFILPPDIDPPL